MMKGNTPKLIKKMIDDVEAAQADIKSGDPKLALHGFATLIAIMTDQLQMLEGDYPEHRRMREFAEKQISDLKASHDRMAVLVDREAERAKEREKWRVEYALKEADRRLREKEARREERRRAKEQAARNAEAKRIQDRKNAAEDARQGKLFDDDDTSTAMGDDGHSHD